MIFIRLQPACDHPEDIVNGSMFVSFVVQISECEGTLVHVLFRWVFQTKAGKSEVIMWN